jgi:hypothetical protein
VAGGGVGVADGVPTSAKQRGFRGAARKEEYDISVFELLDKDQSRMDTPHPHRTHTVFSHKHSVGGGVGGLRAQMDMFLRNPRFVGLKFPDMSRPETVEAKYGSKLTGHALSFMKQLLRIDPAERLTGADCLSHPYATPTEATVPPYSGAAIGLYLRCTFEAELKAAPPRYFDGVNDPHPLRLPAAGGGASSLTVGSHSPANERHRTTV